MISAKPDTLPDRLLAMRTAVAVPQPGEDTIGAAFGKALASLSAKLETQSVDGRSLVYQAFVRMAACRALAMEDADGQYGS